MSRIGKKLISIPDGVKIKIDGNRLFAEGPKGKLETPILEGITVKTEEKTIVVERSDDTIPGRMKHGTVRSLIFNTLQGVSQGFQKKLLIEGVGFKAQLQGKNLNVSAGFSHPVIIPVPEGLAVKCATPTEVLIEGTNKQQVGFFAARIRSVYEPKPYKGKGIRYSEEVIRRKAGKSVAK